MGIAGRLMSAAVVAVALAPAALPADREARCVVVDVFVRSADETTADVLACVEGFAAGRPGVSVVARFVDTVPEDQVAVVALASKHDFDANDLPVVQAVGLIFAAVYIFLNMLADIIGILANPRLRHPK